MKKSFEFKSTKILIVFLFLSAVWPFYLDIRLAENFGLNPQRIVVAYLALLCFFGIFLSKRFRVAVKNLLADKNVKILFVMLVVFFLWRLAISLMYGVSLGIFLSLNEIVTNFFILIVSAVFARQRDCLIKIMYVLVISSAIVALFSYFEWMTQSNPFISMAGQTSKAALGAAIEKTREGFLRAKSTFENTLTLMQYIVVLFPLGMFWLRQKGFIVKIGYFMSMFGAMIFTFSRSGLLVLIMQFIGYLLLRAQWHSSYSNKVLLMATKMMMVLFVVIAVFLAKSYEGDSVSLGENVQGGILSSDERIGQIVNGTLAILDSPVQGFGLGTAGITVKSFSDAMETGFDVNNEVVDNRFLTIGVESGIVPMFAFFIFWVMLVIKLNSSIMSSADKPTALFGISLLLSISGAFITFFVLSIFTIYPIIYCIAGIAIAYIRMVRGDYVAM